MISTCTHPGCGSPYADFICDSCLKPVCFQHKEINSEFGKRFCLSCLAKYQKKEIPAIIPQPDINQLDMFGTL